VRAHTSGIWKTTRKVLDKFQCKIHKQHIVHPFIEIRLHLSSLILSPGSVELAAVGVSISVFNLVSKLFNVPLLNVTTSFVAEQQAIEANSSSAGQSKQVGSSVCLVKSRNLVCVSLIIVIVLT
jgi:hypothetical protein